MRSTTIAMPAGPVAACCAWSGVVCVAAAASLLAVSPLALPLLSSPVSTPTGHTSTTSSSRRAAAPAPASRRRRITGSVVESPRGEAAPSPGADAAAAEAGRLAARPRSPSGIAGTEPFG